MKNFSKAGIILVIFAIGVYSAILVYSDFEKFVKNFLEMKYEYIPIVLIIALIGMSMKVIRQRYLLSKIDIQLSFKQNFLLFFASQIMLTSPGGLGVAIKSQFIKDNHGFSRSRTMSVILIERYHDLLCMVTIITVFSYFYHILQIQLFMIVLSAILISAYLAIRFNLIFSMVTKILTRIPILKKRALNLTEFRDTLLILSNRKIFVISWFWSVFGMMLESLAVNLSFKAFGVNYGFIESTVITLTSIVAGALSFIPGGIGTTEASLIGLLVSSGLDKHTASAITLFVRITTIWYATAIGFIATRFVVFRNVKKSIND